MLHLEKFYDTEIIQEDPLKFDTLLNIFKNVWEKLLLTNKLVLSLRTNQASTKIYKEFLTYTNHLGDIDDINNEEKQRRNTTTIICDNNFKWHCEHYPDFKHFKDIEENKTGMTLRMIDPIE